MIRDAVEVGIVEATNLADALEVGVVIQHTRLIGVDMPLTDARCLRCINLTCFLHNYGGIFSYFCKHGKEIRSLKITLQVSRNNSLR
jgi:hypothetical protein